VYKIELRDLLKLEHVTKNLGHNYWELFSNQAEVDNNLNLNVVQLKRHNDDYLKALKNKLESIQPLNNSYINETSVNFSNGLKLLHNNFNSNKRVNRVHNFNNVPYVKLVNDNYIDTL